MIIHLGQQLPAASSNLPGNFGRAVLNVSLFGLAPDGVYHALPVTCTGGELLPRHFTLTGSEDPAVFFLWHFPPVTRRSRYEPSCPAEFGLSSRAFRPERSCTRSNSLYSDNTLK